jgi:hypothetical protein
MSGRRKGGNPKKAKEKKRKRLKVNGKESEVKRL